MSCGKYWPAQGEALYISPASTNFFSVPFHENVTPEAHLQDLEDIKIYQGMKSPALHSMQSKDRTRIPDAPILIGIFFFHFTFFFI